MRLLFVAPRFHSNQVPLVRALQEAGHEVHVDVLTEGRSEDHAVLAPTRMPLAARAARSFERDAPDNPVAYLADRAYPSSAWYRQRIRRLAPDAVIVRDPNRPYAWRAALAARLARTRVVLYTQGDVHGHARGRSAFLRSAAIAALDAVWISPVPGDLTLPKVHRDAHYLPFAADLDRPIKRTWFDGGAVHLLDIGKFVPRKHHLLLLAAFAQLARDRRVRLTIVGEVSTEAHRAHLDEVEARIDELGVRDLVTVRTNVPFGEMAALYVAHDLFVLPSRDEPASVSVLEAMTHGVPVVCSTTSGTRWYVEPGRTGFVFPSGDVDALARTLAAAVDDRDALRAMGAAARARAETTHDPRAVAARLIALIERGRGG